MKEICFFHPEYSHYIIFCFQFKPKDVLKNRLSSTIRHLMIENSCCITFSPATDVHCQYIQSNHMVHLVAMVVVLIISHNLPQQIRDCTVVFIKFEPFKETV